MTLELINNNAPDVILEVAKKWHSQGKSFYLGPENIFYYNKSPIHYAGGEDLDRGIGNWSVHTDDCPFPPELSLSKEEIDEIAFELRKRTKPSSVRLYLTNRCNAKCYFCPIHGNDSDSYYEKLPSYKKLSVSFEDAKKYIDKIAETGITHVSIGANGEVFCIPYWEEIMHYTAQKGMTQYLLTNGIAITPKVAEKLKNIGNVTIAEVSLHATDFETWSAITGVKNKKAFQNAVQAPLLFKEIGIPTVVSAFVINEKNFHQLKSFLDYWVPKVSFCTVIPQLTDTNRKQKDIITEPFNLCSQNTGLYLNLNGDILPCGYALDELPENLYEEVGIKNINNCTPSEILDYHHAVANNDFFKTLCCKNCYLYQRIGSDLENINFYGYKASTDSVRYRVFQNNPSSNSRRKKTIKDRVLIEVHGVKRLFSKLFNS